MRERISRRSVERADGAGGVTGIGQSSFDPDHSPLATRHSPLGQDAIGHQLSALVLLIFVDFIRFIDQFCRDLSRFPSPLSQRDAFGFQNGFLFGSRR